MRIAFVHDYLTQYGGAERVLEELYTSFADNPRHVYTSVVAPDHLPARMRAWPITASPASAVPLLGRAHRFWLPFYPAIFRRIGASIADADIVIADSSAWAHHAAPAGDTPFLVYCHSPARFLYGDEEYLDAHSFTSVVSRAASPLFAWLRRQDRAAAQRPGRIVANSAAVRDRIRRVWGREAEIVHPPTDTERFRPADPPAVQPWFLIVSRLVPHKWIERAIEASNQTSLPLRIVGGGRAEASLQALAGPQVEFMGQLTDRHVVAAMQQCQALILPGVEDFGLTAVEAQAAGRPVIAAAAGGALETVRPGETGLLVPVGNVDALADAMCEATRSPWDSAAIMAHAETFDTRHFEERMRAIVAEMTVTDGPLVRPGMDRQLEPILETGIARP
jgi:glycosyltransferase involved in cell wall biosynthesis